MAKASKERAYTAREIHNFLRNAVIAAARPKSGPIEDPVRLRQIRGFSAGIIQGMEEFLQEGLLKSEEEIVLGLAAAAFAAHQKYAKE